MEQNELAKSLNVIYQPHPIAPLADRKGLVAVTDGTATVRQVLLSTGIDPHQPITIQLDGELLKVEYWDIICPTEGQLLSVHGTVQGGGGGGSNAVQLLAVIAVAVVATVVTGGALAPVFGTAFAAGGVGAAIAGAVIGVAGSFLIGALFAPKPPTMPNAPGAVSPTYSLSGGQNRARPYEPMPVVMGTHRLFLDYASRPYTEYQGTDQYLIQIFNLGLGNITATDYKIGTTPLTSYTDYSLYEPDSNGRLPDFPGNVDSIAGGALVDENDEVIRTSSNDSYTIGLDFEGILFTAQDNGTLTEAEVEVAVEYRVSGVGSYTNVPAESVRLVGDNAVYKTDGFPRLAVTGSSQKPVRVTMFIEGLTPNAYDIKVVRITRAPISTRESFTLNWTILRSYQLDDSDYKGQNRLGLIIKASEQLNGVVQQLSAEVSAQATYWNGSAWVTGETSNPAHWFMHFARGVYNADNKLMYGIGLSESQIDLASLTSWASFCTTEGLTFNAVIDTNVTAADVLQMISTAGFGSPSWASGKLGVIYDARNASPVMAFGMSNIIRDSFEVAYISENLAEEIVVRFSNPDKDYEQDEVRTLAPDVVTPQRTSAIDLFGCTDEDMAGKFANYVAAQQYYRRRRVTWQSDFEGFVCQRGDVVLLSHDLTQWGYSGRFVEVDGNIVTLDRSVPRQNQIEYLMLIRPDGTTTTYDVAATEDEESDTLILVDAILELQDGANLIDHRWCFSPLETPGKKLKILSVQPASDARLQIVATDEFDEFYDAWDGTFVAPVTDTILPAQPITVTNLTLSTRVAFVNGYLTNRCVAAWGVGGGTLYSRVRFYLDGNLIQEIAETNVTSAEIDISGAGALLVEVTPYGLTGAGATQSATLTLSALDLPEPPSEVTLEIGEDGKAATYTWTPVLGALAYVIEVFANGAVRRTINVGNTLSYTYTLEQSEVDGGAFRSYDFRVYAVNQAGQSTTYAETSFSNPQIGALQNASIEPMPNSLWFKADKPTDADYAGVKVWISKTSGFTPSSATLAYDGAETFVTISADAEGNPLESGVTYYVKAAAYDTFGDDSLTITAQLSATVLSPAWGLLQDDIETSMLESGLRDRIDLIDTSGDPDFPDGLIDGLRRTNTDVSLVQDAADEIGEKLLESALKIQDNTDLLYDAGVTVDSSTGEVYIFAVRENENRLDSAEIRLDAAEANINLRATTTYVDNAIINAVIDPSQIAELGALEARIATAEVDIDGLDAAVTLKADLTVVNSQGARLTTAEADIDALEGQIVLKADNTDLTATTARVSTVETTLNALDVPSITQSVQDVKFISRDQDQIAETQLRDILTGEAHFNDLDVGIAKASTDLRAYTDGQLLAEATSRLELQAQLENTAAALEVESTARATADSALSSQITTLQAETADNAAAIQTEITTRTNADTALASSIITLQGVVGNNTAAITAEQTARANADSALAQDIINLEALTGNNLAAIQAETTARTDADTALASSITTLQSTVGSNTTAIQVNATSIDGIEGKYSVKIDNNGYVSGFGLISTANDAVPFAEFNVIADRFAIAPVATDPDEVDGSPFFVLTSAQTINGVTVQPGTYMKQAFIYDAVITTAKINDLAVTNAKINDLNASKINAGFISADRIEAGSLDAKIATLDAAVIGTGTIDTARIDNLDAGKITTGTFSADRIGADTITADKIDVSTISAISANLGEMTAGTITAGMIKSNTSGTFNGGTFSLGNSSSVNGFLSTMYASQSTNGRTAFVAEHTNASTSNTQSTAGIFINFARQSPALLALNVVNPLVYSVQTSTGIGYGRVGIISTYGVNVSTTAGSTFSGAIENAGLVASAFNGYSVPQTTGFIGFVSSGGLFRYFNSGTTTVSKQISLALSSYAAFSGSGEGKFYAVDGVGPFTGFHEGLIQDNTDIEIGDIVLDTEPYKLDGVSDVTFYMDIASQENQKGVIGICSQVYDAPPDNWMTPIEPPQMDENNQPIEQAEQIRESLVPEGYKVINVNAVGEGQINVCGLNGNIEKGDLIVTSSMRGKGMKQSDDIVKSYTVAKSRISVTFDNPNEVKMIPCVYLCG